MNPKSTSIPRTRKKGSGSGGCSAATEGTAASAVELAKLDVRRATEVAVPSATMLGQSVSITGNGAERAGEVEGAVDRVSVEILRHLEKGRTLVVWAFDASRSLL